MRVLLAMLGASEFPRRGDLSSPAFAKSHTALRDWLLDQAHGPMVAGEDCLDLFNSPRSWPDQEAELADWLVARTATEPVPTDLIVHYVGHGGFRDESRDYYLAISTTRTENPFYSSIMVDSLWRTLRSGARRLRRFLIIDACFAAAAARSLMAPLQEAVKVKVRALQDAEGALAVGEGIVVPDRGTAVLCSSSAHDPSSMAGAGGITQFTDGLMQVLGTGWEAADDRLSLAQVHALVKASLSARYKADAVAPELHAPDQRLGLPQDVPIFPNVRIALATSTATALLDAGVLADLEDAQWHRRRGAVAALAALLHEGDKAAQDSARKALSNRLKQERDYLVRSEIESILGRLPGPLPGPRASLHPPPGTPEPVVKPIEKVELIYVSYARQDAEWVSTLVDHLQVVMAQRGGSRDECQFWMDRSPLELEDFPDSNRDAIVRSGHMIVVLSPDYLKSDNCATALKEFRRRHLGEIEGRILPVERLQVFNHELPTGLQNIPRAMFWKHDAGRVRTLNPSSSETGYGYWARLQDLGEELVTLLVRPPSTALRSAHLAVRPGKGDV
jgi:hypothetical protein